MIEPLTIKCPKCGHMNKVSAMNCEDCHINLDWAQANRESLEVDDKPEQPMNLHGDPTAPVMQKSLPLQKNLGFIIVIVAFTLIFMFFAKSDWLIYLLGILVFGGWIWLGRTYEGNQETKLEKIWSELARETGLAYIPGKGSFLSTSYPKVQGEYRGVSIFMEYVVEGGGGEYDAPAGFTKSKLLVKNHGRFSLEINSNWILPRRFRKHDVFSGNHEFDRHFQVKGTPQEFVHRATHLAGLQELLLSDKSQSKILENPYPFSWSGYSRPSIKLDGLDLICTIRGVYKLMSIQTDMLNLLWDLAQLTEQMGQAYVSTSSVRD